MSGGHSGGKKTTGGEYERGDGNFRAGAEEKRVNSHTQERGRGESVTLRNGMKCSATPRTRLQHEYFRSCHVR